MTISKRLRNYRELRGYSQTELAARSGISRNYVSSIENDHRPRIGVDVLDRLAKTLGITVDHLTDEDAVIAEELTYINTHYAGSKSAAIHAGLAALRHLA
jgi:transcriptional regulator with XRE-family HTH domain